MSVREAYPKPKLPTSHYFFSLARGERMHTFALRPSLLWSIVALAPILAAWSVGASLFIAFHDQMLGAVVAREAEETGCACIFSEDFGKRDFLRPICGG